MFRELEKSKRMNDGKKKEGQAFYPEF